MIRAAALLFSAAVVLSSPVLSPQDIFDYTVSDNAIFITEYLADEPELEIPDEIECLPVTYISKEAFFNAPLNSVYIPDSVISIGREAFYGCDLLKSARLPSTLGLLDEFTFFGCSSLTDITMPVALKRIDKFCFGECTALESVELPDALESICERTFSDCSSLSELWVSPSVKAIENYAFSGCDSLKSLYFISDAPVFLPDSLEGLPQDFTVYYLEGTSGFDSLGCNVQSFCILSGDLSLDGKVTVADSMMLFRAIAGNSRPLFAREKLAADKTGDGNITIADAMSLSRTIAGI